MEPLRWLCERLLGGAEGSTLTRQASQCSLQQQVLPCASKHSNCQQQHYCWFNLGQLQAYLGAFQITRDSQYAWVARSVLDYLMRDMTHPGGGIYAAEVGARCVGRRGSGAGRGEGQRRAKQE